MQKTKLPRFGTQRVWANGSNGTGGKVGDRTGTCRRRLVGCSLAPSVMVRLFLPACLQKMWRKIMNSLPHLSRECRFSPVWIHRCPLNVDLRLNVLLRCHTWIDRACFYGNVLFFDFVLLLFNPWSFQGFPAPRRRLWSPGWFERADLFIGFLGFQSRTARYRLTVVLLLLQRPNYFWRTDPWCALHLYV